MVVEKTVTHNGKKFALEYQFVSRNRTLVFRGFKVSVNEHSEYTTERWHSVMFLFPGYSYQHECEDLPKEFAKLKSRKDVEIPDDVLEKAQKALKLTASREMSKT